MIALAVILAVLTLIAFTRVGARVLYDEAGVQAWVKIGLYWRKIYPIKEKKSKKDKPLKPPKEQKKRELKEKNGFGKLTGDDIRQLIALAKGLMKRSARAFRFDLIRLRVIAGGGDACAAAVNYGRVHAVLGAARGTVLGSLRIKRYDNRVTIDYTGGGTRVYTEVIITVSIGRIFLLGCYMIKAGIGFVLARRNRASSGEAKE